jgi:FKBP-type peptidyl-prolyl cis-trans isomerase SlyD
MTLKKKDFIEIEFTGKIKNGEIFDSNKKENLKKLNSKIEPKPFIFCLGEDMFLKGIDDFLIGKEIGEYTIELSPEEAFGKRDSSKIQMIPMKIFRQHQINPVAGAIFNFDNKIAKILSVSSGRVIVDFNNPLAGKEIIYEIKTLRKVDNLNEKVKSLIKFFTKKDLKFEIKDKKLILEDKKFAQFLNLFKDKFKDILDLELEVKEEKNNSPKTPQ